tara:strand:+ start:9636 stop:10508 length:873 start_codon:yes stop_codon:yes gene_type:complete
LKIIDLIKRLIKGDTCIDEILEKFKGRLKHRCNHSKIIVKSRNFPRVIRYVYHRAFEKPGVTVVKGKKIYLMMSSMIETKRLDTYGTKEPETLEWIENFDDNSVFFDIGANIGIYTLFAASQLEKRLKIYSFEPESLNFSSLNRNVVINSFSESVNLNSIAITGGKSRFSSLNVYNFFSGGNCSQFDAEIESPIMHRQGVFGVSLDDLCMIWGFPQPNYIKIDVDGIEMKVISGARKVLKNPNTKSVLIELRKNDFQRNQDAILFFKDCGFKIEKISDRVGQDPNYIFSR